MNEENYQRVYRQSYERAMAALVPARTETYSPVSHTQVLDAVNSNLVTNNLNIIGRRMYLNGFGTKMVGFMDIETEIGKQHGLKMMLGYRNSYDKSMSVAFVTGATVWICGNGLIGGDVLTFKRKHTGNVLEEMNERIQIGVDRMREDFGRLNLEVNVLKEFSLTPRQKAEVLGVMYFERNLVTPTQLSVIKGELTGSEHFKEDNAWSLYNNVTESLKKSHPVDMINDHIKVHDFMKEITGMKAETVQIPAEAEAETENGKSIKG